MPLAKRPIVLLAEDDQDDQLIFRECLQACGKDAVLVTVNDGVELTDYLNQKGDYAGEDAAPYPDIIFLDLNMPRKDGVDTLKEIREGGFKGVVVVIWTTTDKKEAADECFRLGADWFITKPVTLKETVQNIQAVLDRFVGTGNAP